jgi:predicted aminopeptidase
MVKKFFIGLAFALAVVLLWHGPLLVYAIEQGWGQLQIIRKARPVAEVLADPAFPDSLKAKLLLIRDIRRYAIDSLGLRDTEVYQKVYDQQGKEIMWVVTACEEFRLQPKLWHFPVVGAVPYKGFFNERKARAEAQRLKDEGWDVGIRNPGGWSTLGWFPDPILSGMLQRHAGDLASLIIHEMVHATFWAPDSVELNENIASFIGDTAAYDFLRYRFGASSAEYRQYVEEDQDYRRRSAYVLGAARQLDSLYRTFSASEPDSVKRSRKQAFIRQIVENMDTLQLHRRAPSKQFAGRLPNNTYFMAYRTYQARQSAFRQDLHHRTSGNLRKYIQLWQTRYPVAE